MRILAEATSATTQAAVVIAQLCRKVAQVPTIRHCDYKRLDPVRVARHFVLDPNEADQTAMAMAGSWYSKAAPGSGRFTDDSAAKRASASAEVLQTANLILAPALAAAIAALPEL